MNNATHSIGDVVCQPAMARSVTLGGSVRNMFVLLNHRRQKILL